MKAKTFLIALSFVAACAGASWLAVRHQHLQAVTARADGRKILYYQSAMHPWIKSDKPGKCPICGMNLVPVYEGEGGMGAAAGIVSLNASSVTVVGVQTDLAARRPVRRTLRFAGTVTANSWNVAWFEFTVYQRDLVWMKPDQKLQVSVPSAPGKTYTAQIKLRSIRPFADRDFDGMTDSTTVRAEISNAPVVAGDLGKNRLFNGFYAEGKLTAETEITLTVPRAAVISGGRAPAVYVDRGGGNYQKCAVQLGRVGDDFVEVLDGLNEGDKVVTNGNLLIDSEAQLSTGE